MVFGVDRFIVFQVVPLLTEYSIFTFGPMMVLVHVIGYVVPAYQVTAVLGEVTVIYAGAIVKLTLLTSKVVGVAKSLTLTKHCADTVLGTNHE